MSTPILQSYAGLPINQRPNYTRSCVLGCGTVKVFYPSQVIGSLEELRTRFVCRVCKDKPVVMLSDGALITKKEDVKVTRAKVAKVSRTSTAGSRRLPAMFAEGIVKEGDQVGVLRHADAVATVVDAKNVSYNGETMTFNKFGETILKHVSLNIYIWLTINGTLLNDLR